MAWAPQARRPSLATECQGAQWWLLPFSVLVPPRLRALESDVFEFASCFFVYLLAV